MKPKMPTLKIIPTNDDEQEELRLQNALRGKTIDRYVIDGFLGRGAVARVFKAHNTREPGLEYAIKFFMKSVSNDHTFLDFVNRELKVWERLKKKADLRHIVYIEDFDIVKGAGQQFDGMAYIVMEYMDNKTLEDHYKDEEMDLGKIVEVMTDALYGLEQAHSFQIRHLDFHPGNILLSSGNIVKLSDFGVSGMLTATERYSSHYAKRPPTRFPAPEQEDGKPTSDRTDIFQVGISLLYLTTGTSTLGSDTERILMNGYPDIPLQLKKLMLDCTISDPTKRPPVREVIKTLQSITITEMNPEYKKIISRALPELEMMGRRRPSYSPNSSNILSPSDIDQLYSVLEKAYAELGRKGFPTPVGELETTVNSILQKDKREMVLFANKYYPPEKNMPGWTYKAAGDYLDAIGRWKQHGIPKQAFNDIDPDNFSLELRGVK